MERARSFLVILVMVTAAAAQEPLLDELGARGKQLSHVDSLLVREVRESSAKDVGEALAKLDGLWKVRKGAIANDIVLRAFQADDINVLVDGVRVYGACPGRMDPSSFHVDFAEIETVEVSKGAFDVRNQGSLGGLIHIASKGPGAGWRFEPTLSAGSFDYVNPSLTGSYADNRWHWLAGYSARAGRPYRDGSGRRITEYANYHAGAGDLRAFEINTGWMKLGFRPAVNQALELSYTRQAGGKTLYPYLLMDALYDNADRAGLRYEAGGLSGPVQAIRGQVYLSAVRHWMTDEYRMSAIGADRPYHMATYASTRALGGRLEADLQGITAGFDGYRRHWDAVNTMRLGGGYTDQHVVPNVAVTTGGLFAAFQRTVRDTLRLGGGFRFDLAGSEARSPRVQSVLYRAYKATEALSAVDRLPSWNLHAAYSLPRGLEAFLGAGRTGRLPSPQERYFAQRRMGADWVGNPGLRPARNTELDAGVTYRRGRLQIKTLAFLSDVDDFIVPHNQNRLGEVPGVMNLSARSYENVNARFYGGEVTSRYTPRRTLLVSLGLSWVRGVKDAKPERRIFDRDIAETPPLRGRAGVRWGGKLFFCELEGIGVRAQRRVDGDLRELPTPGYAVVHAKGGIHARRLSLTLGVDNVLDRHYYEHFSFQRDPFRLGARIPEPGRSIFLNAGYRF